MKKKIAVMAVMLCTAISMAACAGEDTSDKDSVVLGQEEEESADQTKLNMIQPQAYSTVEGLNLEKGSYISIIGKSEDSEYWDEVKRGAEDAVDELNEALGYSGKDEIKVTYNAPGHEGDVDEQINILDEELDRYPIAVGIAVIDKTACEVQFDLATENNIPIVGMDSPSDYPGLMLVSTNNQEAGATAADKMAGLLNEQGEVLLFIQDNISGSAKQREAGMISQFQSQYPNITVSGIYYMDELDSMKEETAEKLGKAAENVTDEEVIQQILVDHPNAKGCIAANEETTKMLIDACEVSERDDIQLIGFDGGETLTEALEDGKVEGLIVQNPYGMGYATVVAAARSALNMANEANIDTGYAWVTQDNMEETAIKNMLY
nr:substrate-binding domain-containing protein [uncultured Sellimonas sp.]